MTDQATTLRGLTSTIRKDTPAAATATCEIVAVTSGKGGVGKSNLTLNTAIALTQAGFKVLIMDADMGTANIDILVNMDPRHHLGHVIEGKAGLLQIIQKIADQLYFLPGASGANEIGRMPLKVRDQFSKDLAALEEKFDYLFVDTSAGVSPQVIRTLCGADRILLVCTSEPTSIVDGYALCKVLFPKEPRARVELVANMVSGKDEAQEVYGKLSVAVKHFLKRELHYLSYVEHDAALALGVSNQKPLMMTQSEREGAAANFKTLAQLLAHSPGWSKGRGFHHLFNHYFDL